jgi:hypothetical protein
MKKIQLIVLFFLIGQNTFAQLLSTDMNLVLKTTGAKIDRNRYDEIKGSAYLFEKWQIGTITNENGKSQDVKNMNFNCFQNQFEYEVEDLIYTPINKYGEFSVIELSENKEIKNRIFRNGFIDNLEYKTYFEVLYDGATKVLQKYNIRVDEYAEPLSLTRLKRFTKITQLYIYNIDNKKLIKIKKDKKTLLLVFEKKADVLEKYISENNLKLKTEAEVIQLCTFYDTLK